MATTPENRFIQSVHRLLPVGVYHMKNHNPYNAGIADCWYSGCSGDLWVEYKFMDLPKRSSTIVDITKGSKPALSDLQQQWLKARSEEGRSVAVIIGTPEGGLWLPKTSWTQPLSAHECRQTLHSRQALAGLITSHVYKT